MDVDRFGPAVQEEKPTDDSAQSSHGLKRPMFMSHRRAKSTVETMKKKREKRRTYGDFDRGRWVLSTRNFRVLTIVKTPLNVLFEFPFALQILPQETDEIL